jgi:hypothetical protein
MSPHPDDPLELTAPPVLMAHAFQLLMSDREAPLSEEPPDAVLPIAAAS